MIETNLALFVLAAALGVAFFIPVTDFMVVFYLKKYAVGLAVFMLMPVIALVRGPVILLRPYFLARNREWRLILFQVSGLILAAVLDGLIIWRGWGIAYIVMASAAGYFLTGMLMFIDFERERQSIKRAKYAMLWVGLVGVIGIYLFYQNRATQAGSLPYVAETLAVALAYLVLITGTFWIFRRSWITDVRLFMGGSKVPLFSGIIEKLIARKF
jgi:O-antigen/teichoic acid export membrane protein